MARKKNVVDTKFGQTRKWFDLYVRADRVLESDSEHWNCSQLAK